MEDNEMSRLSRLTAILTQLQTKRLITATELSKKFGVSVRTIYRDMRALEDAGIPIMTEEGRGYALMEGYRLPPVMFTEAEANALITAEQFVLKNKDSSFVKEFSEAINKIKSVLRHTTKNKVNLLSERILVRKNAIDIQTSNYLTIFQKAITDFTVVTINYQKLQNQDVTVRDVEPFAVYHSVEENWLLIAYCRLRKDMRVFRFDRILKVDVQATTFEPQKMTLSEFIESQKQITTPDI